MRPSWTTAIILLLPAAMLSPVDAAFVSEERYALAAGLVAWDLCWELSDSASLAREGVDPSLIGDTACSFTGGHLQFGVQGMEAPAVFASLVVNIDDDLAEHTYVYGAYSDTMDGETFGHFGFACDSIIDQGQNGAFVHLFVHPAYHDDLNGQLCFGSQGTATGLFF